MLHSLYKSLYTGTTFIPTQKIEKHGRVTLTMKPLTMYRYEWINRSQVFILRQWYMVMDWFRKKF